MPSPVRRAVRWVVAAVVLAGLVVATVVLPAPILWPTVIVTTGVAIAGLIAPSGLLARTFLWCAGLCVLVMSGLVLLDWRAYAAHPQWSASFDAYVLWRAVECLVPAVVLLAGALLVARRVGWSDSGATDHDSATDEDAGAGGTDHAAAGASAEVSPVGDEVSSDSDIVSSGSGMVSSGSGMVSL